MKFIDADKLVEFIDSKTYKYKGIMKTTINIKDLLSFISTNSIDIDYSDKIKGRCKDCKWIYTPECRMYEVQVAQNYKEIGSQYCSEFEPKYDKVEGDKTNE